MNEREQFKVGFISRAIEAGYTDPDAICQLAKRAADKTAEGMGGVAAALGFKDLAELGMKGVGKAFDVAFPLAVAGPAVLGAGAGYLAGHAGNVSDYDVEEVKNRELVEEYNRQRARLQRQQLLRKV